MLSPYWERLTMMGVLIVYEKYRESLTEVMGECPLRKADNIEKVPTPELQSWLRQRFLEF